jgi:hypothetical protein
MIKIFKMKKLLLVLLVLLGLQTQAQINYCDSVEISITNTPNNALSLETNVSNFNWANIPTIVEYDWTIVNPNMQWNWVAWDSTSNPNFYITPNSPYFDDTLVICLTIMVYDSISFNPLVNCYNNCIDTLIWNNGQWSLLSMMYTPQLNYNMCDSVWYGTSMPLLSNTLDNDSDTVTFEWTVCAGGFCYVGTGLWAYFSQVSLTDTISVCMNATIHNAISNNVLTDTICTQCDSLIYNPNTNQWVAFSMSNPTSINELTFNKISNDKIYDMLGREVTNVTLGTMYIKNGKKYIRIR